MPADQRKVWAEYVAELPWLTSSHRRVLQLACMLTVRMDDPEMGVSAAKALSSVLSKLGATPVDESKVNHGDDEPEDPADKFFGRPH
jgi:hypothetical protein